MLAGELYDSLAPTLATARNRARALLRQLQATMPDEATTRKQILDELLGDSGEDAWIEPPFFCDYGQNIYLGKKVYLNFNCIVLDVCEVRIGDHVMIGPAVQIYTATHPLNAGTAPFARIWQARHDWVRCLDRRGSDPLPRCYYRRKNGDRCRQRRDQVHPGRRDRRRQSLPGGA